MYTTKKLALAVAGALVLLPLFAATATANTVSEYLGSGIDDICNATDIDGIGSTPSVPAHDDSCNTSDAAHGGPDSLVAYEYSTFNGGLLSTCQDTTPSAANAGTGTNCVGGHSSSADTVPSDAAEFGGDHPLTTTAKFEPKSTTSASAWNVRALYRDTTTGITGTTLGPVVCVAIGGNIIVTVNGGGAADPPAGTTITGVIAWMQSLVGCGTATGRLAPQETWVTYGYANEGAGNAANAAVAALTVTPDPTLPGTCKVTWSASASVPAGTLGRAEVLLQVNPLLGDYYDGTVVAGSNAAGNSVTGVNTAFVGDNVEVTASAWSIGNTYQLSHTGPILCTPVAPTLGFTEPLCIAHVAVVNGVVLPTAGLLSPVCILGVTPTVGTAPGGAIPGICTDTTVPNGFNPASHRQYTCTATCNTGRVVDVAAAHVSLGPLDFARAEVRCNNAALAGGVAMSNPGLTPTVPPLGVDFSQAIKTAGAYTCTMDFDWASSGGVPLYIGVASCLDDILLNQGI